MAVWLWCLFCLLASSARHDERATEPHVNRDGTYPLAFSTAWAVLGPFQAGTREGTWGADPLEYLGGFRALQYDQDSHFRSSLPTNGTAKWSIVQAKQTTSTSTSANASLSISYPDVDWDFLKVVYGWAAVQYQAWARGQIVVTGNASIPVVLYTDWILEYWVDDVHYFGGDFFTFRQAPAVLHLSPGTHAIDLRLVRDVRALGGVNDPSIDVLLELQKAPGALELAKPGILLSDVVDGKLATPIASVILRNSGKHDVEIIDIQISDVRGPFPSPLADVQVVLGPNARLTKSQTSPPSKSSLPRTFLVAGQTRPVAFNISLQTQYASSIDCIITYKVGNHRPHLTLSVSQHLTRSSIYAPHKFTYLHPGGMVSYAMLRPPAKNATCHPRNATSLPILFGFHGAGLEADNGIVAHALDPVPDLCAWVMFPTGVTPWSGDDWHNWGFADVEYAVHSIQTWMKSVAWQGPDIDVGRWIVTGHSNGGQGTWYALTHRPDQIVAAAPVSGYASIQKYVPYELWQPMDPRRAAIMGGTLNSYRHEMLMENAQGIPVLQQHGEKDDNVPAYNSRFLSQKLFEAGTNSSYYELPGQGHYFDTVMTTEQLVRFYYKYADSVETIPRRLQDFTFVVANPGDMGSKSGIRVLHLEDPGQYGKVVVNGHSIQTSNVLSIEFDPNLMQMSSITLDGQELDVSMSTIQSGAMTASKVEEGPWKIGDLSASQGSKIYRQGRQLGAMTAILRTRGSFIIRHQGKDTAHVALQVSRNLHQYFSADSRIASTSPASISGSGNVISVCIGQAPPSFHPNFPIVAGATAVTLRDWRGRLHTFSEPSGLAAAFLRPLEGEQLELVLWGSSQRRLAQAARLVPMLTGVGQPDFVVLGESASWRGVEGALALGFFDHQWNVTSSSLV
ncbi:hypothetical protein EJ04DRAFT_473528 [Polyplosphaeria fusca]|uniref:Peptidase S9 prolyl oligopeptidase catalytic domain-containing protein n=1 Tax=Polyplosphaeria fusca TaxID=682080 RepID=A0A9P4QSC2_9PLEO|nr:hypothetical protein EJ04DRAFT_473528 [Polyplosphaeria fusca]